MLDVEPCVPFDVMGEQMVLLKKWVVVALSMVLPQMAVADETCMSPYMAKIVGQEDFVYIWTLGVEGIGNEQDKTGHGIG